MFSLISVSDTMRWPGHAGVERQIDWKDDVFIQPTVITVKKNRSKKLELDAREMNENIKKDKYQMPNLDLTCTLAEIITGKEA